VHFALAGGCPELLRLLEPIELSREIFDWLCATQFEQTVLCAAATADNADIVAECLDRGFETDIACFCRTAARMPRTTSGARPCIPRRGGITWM
jgi:hypothetical protein